MKKLTWKKSGIILAMMAIMAGNMIGINAIADNEGVKANKDAPDGVMVGYTPALQKIKTGEHIEHWGWIGGFFVRLVDDYSYSMCCYKTNRAMDGCKGFPPCQ
jgi:hypothetical protein